MSLGVTGRPERKRPGRVANEIARGGAGWSPKRRTRRPLSNGVELAEGQGRKPSIGYCVRSLRESPSAVDGWRRALAPSSGRRILRVMSRTTVSVSSGFLPLANGAPRESRRLPVEPLGMIDASALAMMRLICIVLNHLRHITGRAVKEGMKKCREEVQFSRCPRIAMVAHRERQ